MEGDTASSRDNNLDIDACKCVYCVVLPPTASHSTGNSIVNCNFCPNDSIAAAVYLCRQCAIPGAGLCEACYRSHGESVFCRGHEVVLLSKTESTAIRSQTQPCIEHDGANRLLCCRTCGLAVCHLCVAMRHQGHDVCMLHEAAAERAEEMYHGVRELELALPVLRREADEAMERVISVENEMNELRLVISELFDETIDKLCEMKNAVLSSSHRNETSMLDAWTSAARQAKHRLACVEGWLPIAHTVLQQKNIADVYEIGRALKLAMPKILLAPVAPECRSQSECVKHISRAMGHTLNQVTEEFRSLADIDAQLVKKMLLRRDSNSPDISIPLIFPAHSLHKLGYSIADIASMGYTDSEIVHSFGYDEEHVDIVHCKGADSVSVVTDVAALCSGLIVAAFDDGVLRLLDTSTAKGSDCPVYLSEVTLEPICTGSFITSLSESEFVVASFNGDISLWFVQQLVLECTARYHSDGTITAVQSLSHDEFITAHINRSIKVWKVVRNTGDGDESSNFVVSIENIKSIPSAHSAKIHSIVTSADGCIATASQDTRIKLWSLDDSITFDVLEGHIDAVFCMIATDNGLICSGSADCSIKLWDPRLRKCLYTITGHMEAVLALAKTGDDRLISSSADRTLILWDLTSKSSLQIISNVAVNIWPSGKRAAGTGAPVLSIVPLHDSEHDDTNRLIVAGLGADGTLLVFKGFKRRTHPTVHAT